MSEMQTPGSTATTRQKRMAADRDLAMQVRLLKQAIGRYQCDLAEFLPRSNDASEVALRPGEYMLYSDQAMLARLEGAKKGSEKSLETDIKKARKIGGVRRMVKAPSSADLAGLSGNLCVRHNMSTRNMNATQDEDYRYRGQGGAAAILGRSA